jgi:hypothetical protein
MRFIQLLSVFLMLSAFQLSLAQSQAETQPLASAEVNLSRSVHLFPNPAIEYVNVKLDQFPAENVQITVHSIIGNELQVQTEVLDENVIQVKVKDLAAGYYFLAVKDEESNFRGTYKFLKR